MIQNDNNKAGQEFLIIISSISIQYLLIWKEKTSCFHFYYTLLSFVLLAHVRMHKHTSPTGKALILDRFLNGSEMANLEFLYTGAYMQFRDLLQKVNMQNGTSMHWSMVTVLWNNTMQPILVTIHIINSLTALLPIYLTLMSGPNSLKPQAQNISYLLQNIMMVFVYGQARKPTGIGAFHGMPWMPVHTGICLEISLLQ